ncbi:MAG: hypothetical protein AAGA54_08935 [Myxococcota bacterium]
MKTLSTATPTPLSPPTSESSHTFSLEALRARVEAAQTPAPAMAADDSGVIDLRALRDADSTATLGGGTSLLSAASRLVTPAEPLPLPPPSRAPRWAVATVGLLTGAVAALALMALGPHATPEVEDPASEPSMAAVTMEPVTTEGDAEMMPAQDMPEDVAADLEAAPFEPEGPPMPEADAPAPTKVAAATKRRSTSKSKSKSKAKAKSSPKAPAAPAPTTKAPAKSGDLSVDCILDPASCGRGGSTKKAPTKKPSVSLPEKLSSTQIRTALAGPKAKAKQCRATHGADAGTTVKVKLSIAGSGKVRTATPQAPHANALGRCVADALSTADFDAFAKPAMGVVYSVRL